MSKNKFKNKKGMKQNKPYYLENSRNDNMIVIDEKIKEKISSHEIIEKNKFKLNILDNSDKVLLSLDEERPHILYPKQFFALTLACINISKSIIPDCDFSKIINNQSIDRFEKQ